MNPVAVATFCLAFICLASAQDVSGTGGSASAEPVVVIQPYVSASSSEGAPLVVPTTFTYSPDPAQLNRQLTITFTDGSGFTLSDSIRLTTQASCVEQTTTTDALIIKRPASTTDIYGFPVKGSSGVFVITSWWDVIPAAYIVCYQSSNGVVEQVGSATITILGAPDCVDFPCSSGSVVTTDTAVQCKETGCVKENCCIELGNCPAYTCPNGLETNYANYWCDATGCTDAFCCRKPAVAPTTFEYSPANPSITSGLTLDFSDGVGLSAWDYFFLTTDSSCTQEGSTGSYVYGYVTQGADASKISVDFSSSLMWSQPGSYIVCFVAYNHKPVQIGTDTITVTWPSTCAKFPCSYGTLLDETAQCPDGYCSPKQCCPAAPTCGAEYDCPEGYNVNPEAFCSSATCTDAECCAADCTNVTCPKVTFYRGIFVTNVQCTTDLCNQCCRFPIYDKGAETTGGGNPPTAFTYTPSAPIVGGKLSLSFSGGDAATAADVVVLTVKSDCTIDFNPNLIVPIAQGAATFALGYPQPEDLATFIVGLAGVDPGNYYVCYQISGGQPVPVGTETILIRGPSSCSDVTCDYYSVSLSSPSCDSSVGCRVSDCCGKAPACGKFECPADMTLVADPENTYCSSETCSEKECCRPAVGQCDKYPSKCPDGQVINPYANCASGECQETDCCVAAPLCGTYRNCLRTYGVLKDASLPCSAFECTQEECCIVIYTIGGGSSSGVASSIEDHGSSSEVIPVDDRAGVEDHGDLAVLKRLRIDPIRLPSHCSTDETVKVGFTDLGFCGQDYAQANCWRALRAPPGARIQVNVQNVKQPEARSFDVFDKDGEQWYKVGMIRDGEFYPPEGIKSRQGRMCVHFETTISMRESEQSMTYEFV